MGSICLSLVPILRCASFAVVQSSILLIPSSCLVPFCVALLVSQWNSSDVKHLLLAAESLIYFSWTMIDLLLHVVPAAKSSLHVFKGLDIILGSLALVPVLLYTFFLYFTARTEMLHAVPTRLQPVANYVMLFHIFVILVTSTIGSFIGISYRNISDNDTLLILAKGFTDDKAQLLWTIFSSLALALLTSYQFFCLILLIGRTAAARHTQGSTSEDGYQASNFSGTIAMALGLLLGAFENVAGACEASFEVALIRAILRALGRVMLIMSAITGLGTFEFDNSSTCGRRALPLHLVNHGFKPGQNLPSLWWASITKILNLRIRRHGTTKAPGGQTPKLHPRNTRQGELELDRKSRYSYWDAFHAPRGQSPFPFSNLLPIKKPGTSMRTERDSKWGPYSLRGSFDTRERVSVLSTNRVSRLASEGDQGPPVIPEELPQKVSPRLSIDTTFFDRLENLAGYRGSFVPPDLGLVKPLPPRTAVNPEGAPSTSLQTKTIRSSCPSSYSQSLGAKEETSHRLGTPPSRHDRLQLLTWTCPRSNPLQHCNAQPNEAKVLMDTEHKLEDKNTTVVPTKVGHGLVVKGVWNLPIRSTVGTTMRKGSDDEKTLVFEHVEWVDPE